jgi:PAS domain S-box-containing protein
MLEQLPLVECFHQFPLPVAWLDGQGRVVACNVALEQFLGRPAGQLQGVRLLTACTTPDDAAREAELFLEAAAETTDGYRLTKRYQRADGVWCRGRVFVRRLRCWDKPGYLVCIEDLTEEDRWTAVAERTRRLDALARVAGELAAALHHLVLSGLGGLRLLLERLPNADTDPDLVETVHQGLQRAADFLQRLLAFSCGSSYRTAPCDINAVVETSWNLLRDKGRIGPHDRRLALKLHRFLPAIAADPERLAGALASLIELALRRTPAGGQVEVRTAMAECEPPRELAGWCPRGRQVSVRIADSGQAMDRKVWERLFEPFARFAPAVSDDEDMSLELAAAWGVVRQHGGCVEVEPDRGQGLALVLYFPPTQETLPDLNLQGTILELDLEADPAARQLPLLGEGGEQAPAEVGKGCVALLVEDDEAKRREYRLVLENQGFKVLEARDASDALWTCLRHEGPIHVLVADDHLPRMSGRELAERVLAVRPTVQVLLLAEAQACSLPQVAILSKPCEPAALAEALRRLSAQVPDLQTCPRA